MKIVDAGESFSISIDISAVAHPTSATYEIADQTGVVRLSETELVVYGDDERLDIPITSELTTLDESERRRVLVVTLKVNGKDDQFIKFSESLLVQDLGKLDIPRESFQTVNQANMLAMDVYRIDNWLSSSDEDRRKALIEAAHRIKTLRFDITDSLGEDHVTFEGIQAGFAFEVMSRETFDTLPKPFIDDLLIAQIIEADEILGYGATAESKRHSGVLSDTVGETSQMFRTGKPIHTGVCMRAFRYLTRWTTSRWSIGRG
ncbi:hypothetical protein [Halomonas sp. BMC6]|uniref:hypothetical protein n=1 Tax=Halomonas sp. BMC6 TaxID=3073244 RepID=UPI0030CB15F1